MARQRQGMQIVVDLNAEEASAFRHIAMTSDEKLLPGIARSLILGAFRVVTPRFVRADVAQLVRMLNLGLDETALANRSDADGMSRTVHQLNHPTVRSAIKFWAISYGDDVTRLEERSFAPDEDQLAWVLIANEADALQERLALAISRATGPATNG